jgi:addiction module HigA family antidote
MVLNQNTEYDPDYAIPPGETVLEKIEEMGMTQRELALRLGLSEKHISEIIGGTAPITCETAIKLEKVTAIPARFWNNLEANYRERLARFKEAETLQNDLVWLEDMPIQEMLDRKIITHKTKDVEQLKEALAFFGVGSVKAWYGYWNDFKSKVAARRTMSLETKIGSLATWLRQGELEAQTIECRPYDEKKFNSALGEIRKLTTHEPSEFARNIRSLCADSGVAVSFIKEYKNVPWYGASRYLTPTKALIVLNIRGKYEDLFWFSFFHEAGHILNDKKKEVYINIGESSDSSEEKANQFAADFLIPPSRISEYRSIKNIQQIIEFAKSIDIHPGIVAGRYMRENDAWGNRSLNRLRRKLKWVA